MFFLVTAATVHRACQTLSQNIVTYPGIISLNLKGSEALSSFLQVLREDLLCVLWV